MKQTLRGSLIHRLDRHLVSDIGLAAVAFLADLIFGKPNTSSDFKIKCMFESQNSVADMYYTIGFWKKQLFFSEN